MTQRHRVETKLAELWPPADWQPVGVLLAVSGGADSVALLRAMRALCADGPRGLRAAHFNHALRGAAADADEQFVVELCRQLEIPCHVGRPDVAAGAAAPGESLETAARAARYEFLQRTAEEHAARYVATAHTADDQVETILHRTLRGTGLSGLSGMRRARPLGPAVTLLRPLLPLIRQDLVAYLDELGQPYRDDDMNADRRFMRSRIRHELLPLLRKDYNSGVDAALLRLGALAGEVQEMIRPLVEQLQQQAVRHTADRVVIDCSRLTHAHPHLVRELLVALWTERGWPLQAMGYIEWERLRAMAQGPPPAGGAQAILPGGIVVRRGDSTLALTPRSA